MLHRLELRLKLKDTADFSVSCGFVAKKKAPQAAPFDRFYNANVSLLLLSCFLASCYTNQAEQTRAKQPDCSRYRHCGHHTQEHVINKYFAW